MLARASFTGAACTLLVVKTAAAAAGTAETISARSSFSCLRMPAYAVAYLNPSGKSKGLMYPSSDSAYIRLVSRWPLAKTSAGIFLRPSSCTSSNSRAAPSPPTAKTPCPHVSRAPGGKSAVRIQLRRNQARAPKVKRLAAERGMRSGPGLKSANQIVNLAGPECSSRSARLPFSKSGAKVARALSCGRG